MKMSREDMLLGFIYSKVEQEYFSCFMKVLRDAKQEIPLLLLDLPEEHFVDNFSTSFNPLPRSGFKDDQEYRESCLLLGLATILSDLNSKMSRYYLCLRGKFGGLTLPNTPSGGLSLGLVENKEEGKYIMVVSLKCKIF